MVVDRTTGDDEPLCDVRIAEALGDEREHLELTRRELRLVRPRRRARALAGRRGPPAHAARGRPRSRAGEPRVAAARRAPAAVPPRRRSATARAPPRRGSSRRLHSSAASVQRPESASPYGPDPSGARQPRARRAAARRGAGTRPRRRASSTETESISAVAESTSPGRALEPGDLRTGRREVHVGEALLRAGRRPRPHRASASSRPRIAATRAHEGEDAQRLVVRPRRLSRVVDDRAAHGEPRRPSGRGRGPSGLRSPGR